MFQKTTVNLVRFINIIILIIYCSLLTAQPFSSTEFKTTPLTMKIMLDSKAEILKKHQIVEGKNDSEEMQSKISNIIDHDIDLLITSSDNNKQYGDYILITANELNIEQKYNAKVSLQSISIDWYNKIINIIQKYEIRKTTYKIIKVHTRNYHLIVNVKTNEGIVTDILERRVILRGTPPSAGRLI